jgi:hypothetical protein
MVWTGDVFSVVCGALPTGAKLNEPLAPLFNPTLYNVPNGEAASIQAAGNWGLQGPKVEAEEVHDVHLFPWQRHVADKYTEREDGRFGREVHWYFETAGNIGKSILLRCIVDKCEGLQVGGEADNVLYCAAPVATSQKPN